MSGLNTVRGPKECLPRPKAVGAMSSRELISEGMKPAHKSMSKMLGYALARQHPDGWAELSVLASYRMTPLERAGLSFASLRSLPRADALEVAAAALGAAEEPLPIFLGMSEAREWAARASRTDLKAYVLAAFEHMSAQDQAAFYRHISNIEVPACA